MSSSPFFYLCVSNNPNLNGCVRSLEYLDGSALDVLYEGRDLIHLGWKLLANPLYGNFKPNQQPYRSLILRNGATEGASLDMESLSLIENAICVFKSSPKLVRPGELPEQIDSDFRYLDFVLLEETFHQSSVLSPPGNRLGAAESGDKSASSQYR